MTLFQATLFTGLALLAFGVHFIWYGMRSAESVQAFPRSRVAAYILLGTAAAWFLYKVTQLGPADFGQYKNILFIVFLVVALGSYIYVPDFLAVRGLAALILLIAGALLDASFMSYGPALFLKLFVYLAIVLALILGANSSCLFCLRDQSTRRQRLATRRAGRIYRRRRQIWRFIVLEWPCCVGA